MTGSDTPRTDAFAKDDCSLRWWGSHGKVSTEAWSKLLVQFPAPDANEEMQHRARQRLISVAAMDALTAILSVGPFDFIADPNDGMKKRDREGAPWIPLQPSPPPLAPVLVRKEEEAVLGRAVRRTENQQDSTGWPTRVAVWGT